MSVNNSYISIDWAKLTSAPTNEDFAGFLFDAIDDDADWLAPVAFGEQIDHYYFESWNGLMAFNDWFRERRDFMDRRIVTDFSSLFMDIGLLHEDDTFAPNPLKRDLDISSDWLLGAIPPEDVADLVDRADALDVDKIAREFQAAAEAVPCDMVPDGQTIADWVTSLKEGLRATAASGRGIILGAA